MIDEVSQLDLALWSQLQKLRLMNVKFLCIGDWFQMPPIGGHTWAGQVLPETCVEDSDLLQILCDNNRLRLTEPRRSDTELFAYYSSLLPGGLRDGLILEDTLAEARRKFPAKPGLPDLHLVISHRLRKAINRRQNKLTAPADSLRLGTADGEVLLHPGLRMVACMQEKKLGCLNNAIYVVRECMGEKVSLECEISGKHLQVPLDFVRDHLRLAYACTIASVQGQTCRGRLRVHSQHPRFGLKALFVCSSRATSSDLLEIV